ncbi:MAG: hypothetical protein ACRC10_00445 [Thermoguttaceae bacterium]
MMVLESFHRTVFRRLEDPTNRVYQVEMEKARCKKFWFNRFYGKKTADAVIFQEKMVDCVPRCFGLTRSENPLNVK